MDFEHRFISRAAVVALAGLVAFACASDPWRIALEDGSDYDAIDSAPGDQW